MAGVVASLGYRQLVSSAITPILTEWLTRPPEHDRAIEAEMALAIMEGRYSRIIIDPQNEQSPRSVRRFVDRRSYAPEAAFLMVVAQQRRISRDDIVELNRRITSLADPEKRSASSSASRFPELATRFPYDPAALEIIAELAGGHPVDDAEAVAIAAEVYLTIIAKHPFIDGNGRAARVLSLHVLERHFGAEQLDLPLGVVSSANIDAMASVVRRRLKGEACDDFLATFAMMLVIALEFVESSSLRPCNARQM